MAPSDHSPEAPVAVYRFLILTLLAPLLAVRMLWRLARGRESRADLAERLGRVAGRASPGPLIWLHGASVGELVSARAIVETLLCRDPQLRVLVTANTTSGRRQVQSWRRHGVEARLAPVDYRRAVRRFLAGWQPAALITIENEIWPNRMAEARRRRIPVIVAGARLSARSAAAWARFPRLARDILGLIDHLAPLDDASRERFLRLGLPGQRIGGRLNLKAEVRLPEPRPADLAPFAALRRDLTFLAASTHPGEDAIILSAFRAARMRLPGLKLILAPRHPERGDEVAALCFAAGLALAQRSRGEVPAASTDVHLADTLGEMPLWYRLAAVSFVGGSLVAKGGHTPFEPVQFQSVVLHGPHVENHADAYRALDLADAAAMTPDATALAAALCRLLSDAALREGMAARAADALGELDTGGAGIAAFVDRIGPMIADPAISTPATRASGATLMDN